MQSASLDKLQLLGITDEWQLPLLLPSRYLDLRPTVIVSRFHGLMAGQYCVGYGRLEDYTVIRSATPQRITVALTDSEGRIIRATFFGNTKEHLSVIPNRLHKPCAIAGTIDFFAGNMQLNHPEMIPEEQLGAVMSIYPGKRGVIKSATVFERMQTLLPEAIPVCADKLLRELNWSASEERTKVGLVLNGCGERKLVDLLAVIHAPPTPEVGHKAIQLLKLVATEHRLQSAKREGQRPFCNKAGLDIAKTLPAELFAETPLNPTADQKSCR